VPRCSHSAWRSSSAVSRSSCSSSTSDFSSERAREQRLTKLLRWTISDSAAFARESSTALAGEGRAAGIALASVAGVEMHMHPDVGLCSIEPDELTAVLLLRQQRWHAGQPVPRLWNGRCPALSRAGSRFPLAHDDSEVGPHGPPRLGEDCRIRRRMQQSGAVGRERRSSSQAVILPRPPLVAASPWRSRSPAAADGVCSECRK
jgi:hypothetical protein